MAVVSDLINVQEDSLEFGNYELGSKTKKDGFEFQGDIYKIKTFNEITKLVDDVYVVKNKTNLGGKMSISVDLEEGRPVKVDVKRAFD